MPSAASRPSRRRFLGLAGSAAVGTIGGAACFPAGCFAAAPQQTHRQRIENALAGKATDRLPFGFWWHFPNRDRAPRRLAELALRLQRRLDLDFIKFCPYGLYSVVDWGVTLDFPGAAKPPVQASYPIDQPDDWGKLRRFDGTHGEYLVVLEAQRICLEEMRRPVPLVQTVFSPLTSCLKMVGRERLLEHIRRWPEAVHAGLRIVTETTRRFAAESVRRGADGLFFASQTTNRGYLTPEEFAAFEKPYDLEVLDAVRGRAWLNIFHLHGSDVMFDQVLDYPVDALNYHDRESGPPLAELRKRTDKCLIGGIGQNTTLVNGTPEQVDAEVRDAWRQVHRRGLILGPGCVANLDAPPANVNQLRRSVRQTGKQ